MAAKPKKEILTYYGQCACCKEYGYLKRLGTDHNNAGQIENYAKIIEETFCIAVHLESGDKQICEPCIMMLRDASNFKNEIITSAHYSNDGIKIEVKHEQNDNDEDKPYIDDINDEDYKPIKGVSDEEEVDDDEYEEVYDEEGAGDEEGDDDTNDEKIESQEEFEIEYLDEDAEVVKKTVIKNEIEYDTDDEPKPYVIKKKGAIRSYKNYSQTELNRCIEAIQNNDMKLSDAAKVYKIPRKTLIAKMNKLKIKTETPEDEEEKKQYKLKHNQFIEEIEKLLTLTNCTPFKVRAFRFYCAYCYLNGPFFEDAEDLYSHTMSHKKNRIKSIDSVLRPVWMNEILRIDITHLKCNSCDLRLIGWNEMFQHFHEIHSVTFDQAYTRLIPYKLEYELHCALCKEQFSTFYHLDSHMNAHYDNYLCSECGDSFMSETRLKKHVETHENGNFECEYCMKTFTLKKYRAKHIALVHKKKKIFKCLYCNEKFISDHVRHQHIVENHNETLKHINCEICGKLFSFRPYYMAHMRKYHSEVKKYKCDYCSKGFVTKYDHKMHVLRHTGEGKHICTVCSKNFVTGRELRSHSKIHEKNL